MVIFAWLGLSLLRGSLEKPQESSKKGTQPSSSSTYKVLPAMCTINFTQRSIPWLQRATFRRQIVGLFWGYSVNLCKFWRGSKRQRNEKTKLIEFYQFVTPERHSTTMILHHKPSDCQREDKTKSEDKGYQLSLKFDSKYYAQPLLPGQVDQRTCQEELFPRQSANQPAAGCKRQLHIVRIICTCNRTHCVHYMQWEWEKYVPHPGSRLGFQTHSSIS